MKPEGTTPAGASIYIRRSRHHSIVSVDRWPITDATDEQCAAVRALFLAEFFRYVTAEGKPGATFLAQPSIWTGTTTRRREQKLLARLIDIEAGNPGTNQVKEEI
ncbi:hypothetical protein QMG61_06390 [Cryobacterium sp. PH31-AA6]|uniref:hypothetical protein n=1 Tax=Cryobacterium sp. PH31-AA6 TaxID=3046205 RepID=UPI0024BB6F0D|nr:hypothetical protein [Cryobacterium sp. PH31-AA6]MDJ0323390.1 hypothetical protein [Cryobacterium sp. PH31-AA6]